MQRITRDERGVRLACVQHTGLRHTMRHITGGRCATWQGSIWFSFPSLFDRLHRFQGVQPPLPLSIGHVECRPFVSARPWFQVDVLLLQLESCCIFCLFTL